MSSSNDVGNLKASLEEANRGLTSYRKQVTVLRNLVDALKKENAGLRERIPGMETKISELAIESSKATQRMYDVDAQDAKVMGILLKFGEACLRVIVPTRQCKDAVKALEQRPDWVAATKKFDEYMALNAASIAELYPSTEEMKEYTG